MSELRLKTYQQLTLETLRDYFVECGRLDSAEEAFYEVLRKNSDLAGGRRYRTAIAELKDLPYVCLRLPTGAGKTLLASHAPGLALRHLLHADQGVVLWLVTSDTIRQQTLAALKDREHPYRIALERGVGGVAVMDIGQTIGINRAKLNGDTVVIVATIQSFRRDKAEWLRVHRDSSASMDVFERWQDLPDNVKARLEMQEGGERPLYSLANALCLRRPLVIVDEAHNANTPLSFDTLAKVYPSCILEFTATPKGTSNVLHSVSAAELDAEAMIKMPIRLETRPQWRELLGDAIRTLDRLEQQARLERTEHGGEYLRPVMLLQAQKRNEEVTVDVLLECLKTDYRIADDQVAVVTGDRDTLGAQNVMSPDCKIRFIVTVDKLREGWDCPFAYVLATVREMKSSTAIEQILGRVMRLPNARKKKIEDLNRAYAFSVSEHIGEAIGHLRNSLVEIGFEKEDAKNMVVPAPQDGQAQDMFGVPEVEDSPAVSVRVPEPLVVEKLSHEAQAVLRYEEATESIVVSAPITESVRRELDAVYTTPEGKAAVLRAVVTSQKLGKRRSPVEQGQRLVVPLLCYRQGDFLEPFEETHFSDHPWRLSEYNAVLSEAEYPTHRPATRTGEVFQDGGLLRTRFVSLLQEQMERLWDERGWTAGSLAHWIDQRIQHRDISKLEAGLFLTKVLDHLMTARGIALEDLLHEKYRLRDAIEAKIEAHRQAARKEAYQALLFPDSALDVSASDPMGLFAYTTSPYSYGTDNPYSGRHVFGKHFYPRPFELETDGEEFQCACFLDSLPEVEYWVRNLPRRPDHSFWLQTCSDRAYPDFVCKLTDGRILAVEFKGENIWSNDDSREKRIIGELWEARSKGHCLFVMPKGMDFQAIGAKVAARV